jgi:RES domain-containing protein
MQNARRDNRLIDALEALATTSYSGRVWRVVREGHDPCRCNASGGRWDDGTFDVLYTSQDADGAIAELYFHLKRGLPVFPSRVQYRLNELRVTLDSVVDLSAAGALAQLGVDMPRYGQLSYQERVSEYPRTQEIGEVSHFLDNAGIIVPNARWDCANVIAFCDRVAPDALEHVRDHGLVDWRAWQQKHAAQIRF